MAYAAPSPTDAATPTESHPVPLMGVILAQATNTLALMPNWLNPDYLLHQFGGYVILGLCLVIFIESSVFPVLPGDSLLFTAGLYIANDSIQAPLWLVCVLVSAAALLGNALGYFIGYKAGPAIFNRPDSRFFKKEYVDKTHTFLEKHGPKAIVLARFVPFVRTFITWIAGIGRMDPKRYFSYTIIGGILWAAGITVLGSILGNISFVRNHVDLIFVVIVLASVLPILVEYFKARKQKKLAPASDESVTTPEETSAADESATETTQLIQTSAEVTQQIPRVDR